MRGSWRGEGPAVVLLHGQPGGAEDWDPVLPHLAGLRLLVPDRPGYDGTAPESLASNAGRLADVLSTGGSGRAVVVGHSWGGGVALRLALDYPERVAALCLVGSIGSATAVSRTDGLLSARGIRHLAGAIACATPVVAPHLVGLATGSVLSASQRLQLRATARSRLRREAVAAFAFEQRALVREAPRLAAQLPDVSVPCLVLTGSLDRTVPRGAAQDLAARLPRGVLVTVEGGHLLPLQRPDAVAAAIRRAVTMADW